MIYTIGFLYIFIYTHTVTFLSITKAGDAYIYRLLVKESVRILEYKSKISKILTFKRSKQKLYNSSAKLLKPKAE